MLPIIWWLTTLPQHGFGKKVMAPKLVKRYYRTYLLKIIKKNGFFLFRNNLTILTFHLNQCLFKPFKASWFSDWMFLFSFQTLDKICFLSSQSRDLCAQKTNSIASTKFSKGEYCHGVWEMCLIINLK